MAFFSKTLDKLKGALGKTREILFTDVRTLFVPGRQIDDEFLAELEEKFLQADMGVGNAERIIAAVRDRWRLGKIRNAAKARNFDVLIVDTAGRLHTQDHLMRELTKIRDVVAKRVEGAPHEVLLVLDATTGQNAILQAKNFGQAIDVTGIILAKLDGSAKGGVVIAIKEQLKIPVKFIGLGETPQDIETFDPQRFVDALFGEKTTAPQPA